MVTWQQSGDNSFYAYVLSSNVPGTLIDNLYRQGTISTTGRARLCFHDHPESPVHIMLIHHDQRTIVPIHKHRPFGEFIFIREGDLELVFYDDKLEVASVSCLSSNKRADGFCSIPANVWHTLRFNKPTTFFEISQGPLDAKITEVATRA